VGSEMCIRDSYGNLFQARQNVTYIWSHHAIKAGIEVRLNRDTTYFGISPNGEYDFGGGSAYATEAIPSANGNHNLRPGDLLPDTLSSFLSGSPFAYTRVIAPPYFSNGPHIGPAGINRNDVNWYVQDTWKITPRFTLDYGLRWELYTPISERARRTSGLVDVNGGKEFVVNPQPGYHTDWNGWGPRVQAAWQVTDKLQAHVGGGITVIPPNIYQDNFLTGQRRLWFIRGWFQARTFPSYMVSRLRPHSCRECTRPPDKISSRRAIPRPCRETR